MRTKLDLCALLALLPVALLHAAPANDNFASRIALLGPNVSLTSSNVGATKETGETNHAAAFSGYTASGKSVWYSWTPTAAGYVKFTLTGSFNKVIAIYTGSSVASLSPAASGFNNSPYDATSYFVAAAATEYLVAVDGYGGGSGVFTLSLAETPPPANDNFADRIALTGTNVTLRGTNISASKETGEPNHAGGAGGQSVWWTWTAPTSGWATFKSSANFGMLLGVYTGDSLAGLIGVASGQGNSWQNPAVAGFNATAGISYQIAVDGASSSDYSDYIELNLVLLPPPANDNFAGSTVLSGTNVDLYAASNLSATKEPGEPNHAGNPGGHSVWWVWTAPVSGRFAIFTDVWMGPLAPLDRLLGIYTGASVSALTEVASASGRSNTVAKATFEAIQGTVYHFAVDGQEGVSGAFNLYLRLPPSNDDFANRFVVANTNVTTLGTNANATSEPGEPNHAGNTSPPTSVWWKWTAPVSGRAVVSVTSSYSQNLGVYTGTTVSNLTSVASGTGNSIGPAYANFDAIAGTEYEIAVDRGGGAFSLLVQYVPVPANDAFASRVAVTNTTGANFYVTGSNLGATKETGETWQGSASVWWTWTAATNGEVLLELETYGTTMTFPWLNLYSGTTLSNLIRISPRVEFAGMQNYHDARFQVVAGTTYSIWVASRGGKEGTYTLRGTFEPPPANDNFANRATLTNTPFLYQYGYQNISAYNCQASKETGEPWHGGANYYYGGKSVWWTWTAPYNGRASVTVSPVRYTFSSMAGLYTGTTVNSLTRITNAYTTCTDGSCGISTPVSAGTTYQISADGGGSYGDSGEFTLSLSVNFDTNAPSVTITNPLPGYATNAGLIVSGTARDLPGTGAFNLASGVNLVEVRLNSGAWLPATGTNAWNRAVTLAAGSNTIEARARDALGNYSFLASVTVTYGTFIASAYSSNGQPQLTFPSVVGNTYQLECATNLVPPISWNPVLLSPVAGTGLPMTLADTNPPAGPQCFYRLVVQ